MLYQIYDNYSKTNQLKKYLLSKINIFVSENSSYKIDILSCEVKIQENIYLYSLISKNKMKHLLQ